MTVSTSQVNSLVEALMNKEVFNHKVDKLELVETHISWVILTGSYAYKIKKPVNFGFLDFSTLEKRKFCCEEELRLNSRTAPDIYLGVVTVGGTLNSPRLSEEGNIIEYAVKMKQFSQDCQLDNVLLKKQLNSKKLDAFSHMIAKFHQSATVVDKQSVYGDIDHVINPVMQSIDQIREHINDVKCVEILDRLEHWIKAKYHMLLPVFMKRKALGFIRECHGDLHLRNLAWVDQKPLAFDCIEFNPDLRWIDVISDISFLMMDLQARKESEMAQRVFNAYLEQTGDYYGVQVLSFYLMYRALVRAKVAALSLSQAKNTNQDRASTQDEFYQYLNLADSYVQELPVSLMITHGLSASGKSTISQQLLQMIPAIRLRSDVERKRLAGIDLNTPAGTEYEKGIYTTEFSDRLYNKLESLSAMLIDSGYSVIVDAAFLDKTRRDQFSRLAKKKGVKFNIISLNVSPEILRKRMAQRTSGISDAGISVLELQLLNYKPLDKSEKAYTVNVDANKNIDKFNISEIINRLF